MDRIDPEYLLLKCMQCEAWPMAIRAYENDQLFFRCPKCHAQEAHRVGVAGRLVPAPELFPMRQTVG
jgi:Zn finger protein HypA/HybF involved in hydrogenase expression